MSRPKGESATKDARVHAENCAQDSDDGDVCGLRAGYVRQGVHHRELSNFVETTNKTRDPTAIWCDQNLGRVITAADPISAQHTKGEVRKGHRQAWRVVVVIKA